MGKMSEEQLQRLAHMIDTSEVKACAAGKRELLPYVYVDDDDVAALTELDTLGVRLEARDVPQARPVDVAALLREE